MERFRAGKGRQLPTAISIDTGVGHQQIVSDVGHDLRFADLGDGEPDGAALHLHAADLHGFVRLGVRADLQAMSLDVCGHTIEIPARDGAVDKDRGGWDLGNCIVRHGAAFYLRGRCASSRSIG